MSAPVEKDVVADEDYLLGGGVAAASSDPPALSPLGLAALGYALEDKPVFPCEPGGKRPLGRLVPNGLKNATTDPDIIKKWWTEEPTANIAIPTGLPTTFIALDVDIKPEKNIRGDIALEGLVAANGALPTTRMQFTPSGGKHFLFAYTPGIGNSAGALGEGLDIRGEGGYIVVAPSILPNGVYTVNDAELAEMPGWLTAKLSAKNTKPFTVPDEVTEGNRNDILYRLARSLKAKGLPAMTIGAAIMAANQDFKPPLPDAEVETLIANALRQPDRPDFAPPAPAAAPAGKIYSRTDTGNAERFADQYRDRVRYCDKWKSWVVYDGRRWVKDTDGLQVGMLMKDSILSIYDEAAKLEGDAAMEWRKHAVKSEAASRREGALRLARYELAISVDRFDADPQVLNCRNGALDLRTFTLQPQSAEAFCTRMAETDYVPGATDATWERFITEKLPDPQTRAWVQMGCGYALTGDRREEIMLNFYGPTRGGKTTMAQTLESMLGDYATTVPAEAFMRSRRDNDGEGNRPTLARLKGTRLVVSAEASDHHQLDDGLVKLITGGDPLSATAKYEHPMVFKIEFLWVLHGNYLVKVRGDDPAIWNRIRLVPFNVTVKKEAEDPTIKAYLTSDPAARSAVLAWCVEGLRRYQANPVGLKKPPPEVVKATEEYRDKMNALATFIEACCVLEAGARVSASELRTRYEAWCIRENVPAKSRASSKDMAERLRELRCEEARTKSERYWVGIRLQKPNEEDQS